MRTCLGGSSSRVESVGDRVVRYLGHTAPNPRAILSCPKHARTFPLIFLSHDVFAEWAWGGIGELLMLCNGDTS